MVGLTLFITGNLLLMVVLTDRNMLAGDWDGKTLLKTGTGTLILKGQNTYTGLTNIAQGEVSLEGNCKITEDVEVYVASN